MVQVIQPSVATSLGEDVVETETNIGISDRSDERIVKALMSEKILNELKQAKNKDSDPSRIIEERVKTIYRQGVSFE